MRLSNDDTGKDGCGWSIFCLLLLPAPLVSCLGDSAVTAVDLAAEAGCTDAGADADAEEGICHPSPSSCPLGVCECVFALVCTVVFGVSLLPKSYSYSYSLDIDIFPNSSIGFRRTGGASSNVQLRRVSAHCEQGGPAAPILQRVLARRHRSHGRFLRDRAGREPSAVTGGWAGLVLVPVPVGVVVFVLMAKD